jgi:enamine deaminase RidA (YjgF/YER057c/UK114 family)
MAKKSLNPVSLFASGDDGFSQLVVASGRQTVYISGQTAWDAGKKIRARDLPGQMRAALHNVQTAVEATGGTLADIVALRIYVVDYRPQYVPIIADALRAFFPAGQAPASTWLGVQALALEEFIVEIEATAVLD